MIDIISAGLICVGLLFFFATTIGILRFPDFYSRMQAAGKGDTMSSMLVLSGLALYNLHHLSVGAVLVSIKILFILVFIFMASPAATHHIIEAGYDAGVKPWAKESEDNPEDKQDEEGGEKE